uniref:Plastid lipid-associated protein/fibrillin conserved domain-containing protein n=1 Tax=Aureoumbra lagunensis TaxID=44058 RepID=A0A6S8AD16_9STRA|mmetsp:Transcript_8274/g.12614  ORF Transcript_8274/g.12614 Transcript_8274/m.12614 type:complete len:236 (-) Transcript_8274:147-854(-)
MMKIVFALLLTNAFAFVPSSTVVTPVARRPHGGQPVMLVSKNAVSGLTVLAAATAVAEKPATTQVAVKKSLSDPITKDEVRAAVRAWCDGIVDIGRVYKSGGDYKARAIQHIEKHYAFDSITEGSKLLFKPTLASEYNFRSDMDEFISYFIGDGVYSEDGGFAIKPWDAVRFDTFGTFIVPGGSSGTTSGIYHFTPSAAPDTEVKVEYTFQFIRSKTDPSQLKIVLHHSSVPFSK